ncbi:hypothetical protein HMPREF9176_0854 [Streptococcus downei F0415]|nr:hypothetical protein HMPREF9176_0854 [Streptococcus downei F0415]
MKLATFSGSSGLVDLWAWFLTWARLIFIKSNQLLSHKFYSSKKA